MPLIQTGRVLILLKIFDNRLAFDSRLALEFEQPVSYLVCCLTFLLSLKTLENKGLYRPT